MAGLQKVYNYHFIYKTTNIKNGKFYIGMHSTDRLDDGYLGSGKRLKNSVRKHGKESHVREILEYLSDRSSLNKREREIINEDLLNNPFCMNLVHGGEGGFPLSPEHVKKFSRAGQEAFRSKLLDPEFKKKFILNVFSKNTPEEVGKKGAKEFLSRMENSEFRKEFCKKTPPSIQGRRRLSELNKKLQLGERNSQFGTFWIFKGDSTKKIESSEFYLYKKEGWTRGRNSKGNSRRIWVYRDFQRKRILEKDLEFYINDNWISKSK